MTIKRNQRASLQIKEFRQRYGDTVTIEQLSILTGVNAKIVSRLISFELIKPVKREHEPAFQIEAVPKIRKLMRLHQDLGIGWSSMAVVLDLLDRIDQLERQLQ